MTLFLIDASHYQSGLLIAGLRAAGFPALILKATQGTTFTDPAFAGFLAAGRQAGLLLGAYHFLQSGSPANLAVQAALTARVVPADIPVWVDVEGGSTRDEAYVYADALRRAGGKVGGIYHGAQPKPGYGAWWRPAYLSDPTGSATTTYAVQGGDKGSPWAAGTLRHPDLWQFCQHGRIPGFSGDVDFNAYRGTLDQLASSGWFWVPPGLTPTPPEADMPLTDAELGKIKVVAKAAAKEEIADYFERGPTRALAGVQSPLLRLIEHGALDALAGRQAAQAAGTLLAAVAADVDALQPVGPGGADVDAIAARIAAALSDDLATVLLDRLRSRLEA